MAVTQADIDALVDALKNPSQAVQFSDGRRVQYRSVAEIREALAALRLELAAALSPGVPSVKSTLTTYTRG